MVAGAAFRRKRFEVFRAEFDVGDIGGEHVVDDGKVRVCQGDNCAFLSAASSETMVLGAEVGILGASSRPRGLCKRAL